MEVLDDNSQVLKDIKKEFSDSNKVIESGTVEPQGLHSIPVDNDQSQGDVPHKTENEYIIIKNVFGPAGRHRPLYIVPNISDGSDFISNSISRLTLYQRDRINDIITICNKNVEDQKSCVDSLLKICCKLSDLDGGEDYVCEITLICNNILSETCKKSLSIIGLCQAFTESFPSKPSKRKKKQRKKSGDVIPSIDVTIPEPSTSKTQTEEESVKLGTEVLSDKTFQTNDDTEHGFDICDSDLPEVQNATNLLHATSEEVIPSIDIKIPEPSLSKTQTEEEAAMVRTETLSDNETFLTNDNPEHGFDICDSDLPVVQNATTSLHATSGEIIPSVDVTIPAPSTSKTQTEEETAMVRTEIVSDNETFLTNDDPENGLDIDSCDSDSPDSLEVQNATASLHATSTIFVSDTDSFDEAETTDKVPPVVNEQVAQCDSMPVSSDSDSCYQPQFDGGTVKDQEKTSIHQTKSRKMEGDSTIQKLLFLSQIQCSSKRKRKLPKRIQEQLEATKSLIQGELEKDEEVDEDEEGDEDEDKGDEDDKGDEEKHKGDEDYDEAEDEEEEEDEELLDVASDDEKIDPNWSLEEDKNDSDKGEVETSAKGKKFACVHCNMKYSMLSLLQKHEKKHTCPICHKIISLSHMRKHKNIHKSNPKDTPSRFICDKCGLCFKQNPLLNEHILQHHCDVSVRPFPCDQCDGRFITMSRLNKHKRSVHENIKKYQCDQCGARLTTSANFKDHMQRHTGVRPFQCDVCQKSFFTSKHLLRHKRTHGVTFKHTCKVCKKGFNQCGNLKTHMRTHTGEKPYICTKCGIGFAHNVTRKQHMKTCFITQ